MTKSLNIYKYDDQEYFQLAQIAESLGYTNITDIIKKISDEYKVKFKDFKGLKIPKIDPRSYLTTVEGISEIVASSDKKIDPVFFNILKSHGVNMYAKNNATNVLNKIKSIFEPEKVLYDYEFEDGLMVNIFFKESGLIVESVKDDSKIQAINDLTGFNETNWMHFDADSELFNTNLLIQEIHTKIIKSARQKYFDDEKDEGEIDYQSVIYGVQTYVEDKGDHLQYYAVGAEFCTLLGFKNPVQAVKNKVSGCNRIEFQNFNGVKNPIQKCSTLLVRIPEGIQEILLRHYDALSDDIKAFMDVFHISLVNCMVLRKEQYTLNAITNAFKTERYEYQYNVRGYRIDFLFTEYNICIEIDEFGHADRKPENERERMDVINRELGIDDTYWIRINPDDPKFEMSKDIGRINRRINQYKDEKLEREKKIHEEKLILEQQEREKIEDELKQERIKNAIESHPTRVEIEETWMKLEIIDKGKFAAPPKDYLIEKLKKYNISDIAQHYGISTNPVSKWLKQYDLNIKDFHNYDPPSKEDLVKISTNKSQTEIANHYNVTCHIVRKWLKKYDLNIYDLKLSQKQVTKNELIKLIDETSSKEELAEKLNVSEKTVDKIIQSHNIDKMPSKEELEKKLHLKSKDDLAVFYNTCRTTLRKWIKSYCLEDIRFTKSMNRPIIVTQNNIQITYESMKELEKELIMSHYKVGECIKNKEKYKGYEFRYVDDCEDVEDVEEKL